MKKYRVISHLTTVVSTPFLLSFCANSSPSCRRGSVSAVITAVGGNLSKSSSLASSGLAVGSILAATTGANAPTIQRNRCAVSPGPSSNSVYVADSRVMSVTG